MKWCPTERPELVGGLKLLRDFDPPQIASDSECEWTSLGGPFQAAMEQQKERSRAALREQQVLVFDKWMMDGGDMIKYEVLR